MPKDSAKATSLDGKKPAAQLRRRSATWIAIVAALVCLVALALWPHRGEVRIDERVVLFTTAAHLSGDGRAWIVPIHGWVFEPEQDDAARAAIIGTIRRTLELDEASAASTVLRQRLAWFLVDNQRSKRVVVRVAGMRETLGPTDAYGHFAGTMTVPVAAAKKHAKGGSLVVEAHSEVHPAGTFRGEVRLVGPSGLSVISDIDDTIKVSQVPDRKELLRNTLLRDFRAADGMPEVFGRWSRAGVAFHYVSSSPWQLYLPLRQFMVQSGLPTAPLELKTFRLKDSSVLDLWADPIQTKPPIIEGILKAYPGRRFCLVGDSGERDPEIYGLIARRHAAQIACIYIRNVTDEAPDSPRFVEAFRKVDQARWRVFTDPQELPPPS